MFIFTVHRDILSLPPTLLFRFLLHASISGFDVPWIYNWLAFLLRCLRDFEFGGLWIALGMMLQIHDVARTQTLAASIAVLSYFYVAYVFVSWRPTLCLDWNHLQQTTFHSDHLGCNWSHIPNWKSELDWTITQQHNCLFNQFSVGLSGSDIARMEGAVYPFAALDLIAIELLLVSCILVAMIFDKY